MPIKSIIPIVCFSMGMTLLTFWLSAHALFSHTHSRIKPLTPAEITAAEACGSALWKLRCASDDTYSAPPAISTQGKQRSVQIFRAASA